VILTTLGISDIFVTIVDITDVINVQIKIKNVKKSKNVEKI